MNEDKIRFLRMLANGDEVYRKIKERYKQQEESFAKIVASLTNEQQDILWAFVLTSDELDHRLLEIACDYIHFN